MRWKVDPPGFIFDSRRHIAKFAVIVPGTNAMRRRKKTIYVEKKDAALERWTEFREEVLRGEAPKPKVVTFGDYVGRHLPDHLRRVSPATATSYEQMSRIHLLTLLLERQYPGARSDSDDAVERHLCGTKSLALPS